MLPRTLVAEGSYAVLKPDGRKPYDSWKLWRELDGSFSAEAVAGPAAHIAGRLVQTFGFDRRFLPSGYSLNLNRVPQGDTISFSCSSDGEKLSCDSEAEGKKSPTSTLAKGPCVVALDEFIGIDLPWFFTSALRIFDGNKHLGHSYVLKEKSLGQMSLELDDSRDDQLVFAGEETTDVLGKSQTVRTYEFSRQLPRLARESPREEVWVVRILSNGLIESVRAKGVPGSGFQLAEYKEYTKLAP